MVRGLVRQRGRFTAEARRTRRVRQNGTWVRFAEMEWWRALALFGGFPARRGAGVTAKAPRTPREDARGAMWPGSQLIGVVVHVVPPVLGVVLRVGDAPGASGGGGEGFRGRWRGKIVLFFPLRGLRR